MLARHRADLGSGRVHRKAWLHCSAADRHRGRAGEVGSCDSDGCEDVSAAGGGRDSRHGRGRRAVGVELGSGPGAHQVADTGRVVLSCGDDHILRLRARGMRARRRGDLRSGGVDRNTACLHCSAADRHAGRAKKVLAIDRNNGVAGSAPADRVDRRHGWRRVHVGEKATPCGAGASARHGHDNILRTRLRGLRRNGRTRRCRRVDLPIRLHGESGYRDAANRHRTARGVCADEAGTLDDDRGAAVDGAAIADAAAVGRDRRHGRHCRSKVGVEIVPETAARRSDGDIRDARRARRYGRRQRAGGSDHNVRCRLAADRHRGRRRVARARAWDEVGARDEDLVAAGRETEVGANDRDARAAGEIGVEARAHSGAVRIGDLDIRNAGHSDRRTHADVAVVDHAQAVRGRTTDCHRGRTGKVGTGDDGADDTWTDDKALSRRTPRVGKDRRHGRRSGECRRRGRHQQHCSGRGAYCEAAHPDDRAGGRAERCGCAERRCGGARPDHTAQPRDRWNGITVRATRLTPEHNNTPPQGHKIFSIRRGEAPQSL
jgi:hypothetical protein